MSISIQNLLQSIKKAADLIAKEPPQIVLDIFQRGIFKNNAGTRGGKLATLVFIQGVCRSLAYDCVNNFVYMIDEETLTKDQLILMLPRYLRANANFLGYCGFDEVWYFAKNIIQSLPKIQTKAELGALMDAYYYYLANLYTWVQHYFPWKLNEVLTFELASECISELEMITA